MLIFSLTLVYLFVAIQDADAHVLRDRDPPAPTVKKPQLPQPRNLDIPTLIDPVQQSISSANGDDLIDDQLRRTKSVFSVPVRPSPGSASDCPQGTRRVTENGPCLTEAPIIKSSGDKFLVDSLRKFYSPNTHHTRPHHRKRRPSTTTTARPPELVPPYVTGELDLGHESDKPGDDTLTITGAEAELVSSAVNESPTIETETTETIIATSVKSELPAEAEDAATTEIPIKSAITESTPAVAEPKGLSAAAAVATVMPAVEIENLLVFEATTLPNEVVFETTLTDDGPIEVTTGMVLESVSGDKMSSKDSLLMTDEQTLTEAVTEQSANAIQETDAETTMMTTITVNETMTSPSVSHESVTTSTTELELPTPTVMTTTAEDDEIEFAQTEAAIMAEVSEAGPTRAASAPVVPVPAIHRTMPSTESLLDEVEVQANPIELRNGTRRAVPSAPERVPVPVPVWNQLPYHQNQFHFPAQTNSQLQTRQLPVQIDVRNPPGPQSPPPPDYQNRNFNRGNVYQNGYFTLDYLNQNGFPRTDFRTRNK